MVTLEIKPLTFKEIREYARMCDNGQPCIFDLEVIGRISRVQLKCKELKSLVKEYYSITIRSLQDDTDYFIVHVDKKLIDEVPKTNDLLYARGTLFKIDDFVFLSANKVKIIRLSS